MSPTSHLYTVLPAASSLSAPFNMPLEWDDCLHIVLFRNFYLPLSPATTSVIPSSAGTGFPHLSGDLFPSHPSAVQGLVAGLSSDKRNEYFKFLKNVQLLYLPEIMTLTIECLWKIRLCDKNCVKRISKAILSSVSHTLGSKIVALHLRPTAVRDGFPNFCLPLQLSRSKPPPSSESASHTFPYRAYVPSARKRKWSRQGQRQDFHFLTGRVRDWAILHYTDLSFNYS
jgi:hypothetical protein